MNLQYRYLQIVIGSSIAPVIYYLGWYSLPVIFLLFFQHKILHRWMGGYDTSNVPEQFEQKVTEQKFYRYVTYLHVYIHCAVILWAIWLISTGVAWYWQLFLIIAIGSAGGSSIITAHELVHRTDKYESFLGGLLLSFLSYATFKIEHVRGHHVTVSTPEDASSAKLGQSLYNFIPRAIYRNTLNGFKLEAKRMRRLELNPFHWRNELIWWTLISVTLAAGSYILAGLEGLLFFTLQSLIAIVSLEMVNYVEHYGLERRKLPNGRYERVSPLHSWNASGRLQNGQMLNLMRHSDHHANPSRRYQILRHFEEAPQLPRGYGYMLNISMLPKKWFEIMDPLATAHMEKLKTMRDADQEPLADM